MDNNNKTFPRDTISISPNTYVAHSIEDANANHFHIQDINCPQCVADAGKRMQAEYNEDGSLKGMVTIPDIEIKATANPDYPVQSVGVGVDAPISNIAQYSYSDNYQHYSSTSRPLVNQPAPTLFDLGHLRMDSRIIQNFSSRPIKQEIDWKSVCIVCDLRCELLINIRYVGDFWAKMQAIRKELRKYGWELLGEIVDGKVNPLSAHISCRAMEKIDQIKRSSVLIEGAKEENE